MQNSPVRIERGTPDDHELAALIAVLAARPAPAEAATTVDSAWWRSGLPQTDHYGRSAWRRSGLPR